MMTDHENGSRQMRKAPSEQELKQLEEKLRETLEREASLRDLNQCMEEFLGASSHELRTPLTTIKASIQLALRRLRPLTGKTDYDPEEINAKITVAQDMLARAERQVDVLNRLVGDMIDISRIQSGKLPLYLQTTLCNIVTIVQETIREHSKAVPERSILLETPIDEEVLIVADPKRIRQVLMNYVDNALKYASSPVTVRLQHDNRIVRVAVEDKGPGIPLEEQERIWECFYQVPNVKVVNGSGTGLGLGLHINRTIITCHSGQVGVNSVPEQGATFWFTLPIAQHNVGE